MKRLIEEVGGTVLLGDTLIQFSEASFEVMFRHVYEAGIDQAASICYEYAKSNQSEDARNCAVLIYDYIEQSDTESDSSGGTHGRH